MTRFSRDFRAGFATGVKAAVRRPGQAREAAEWRIGTVILFPDRVWALVTLLGSVIQLAGWPFLGFVVLLFGVAARS